MSKSAPEDCMKNCGFLQTDKGLDWVSRPFLPWRWRRSGAADPAGGRQEHQGAALQEGGGDGRRWHQHPQRHPRLQVKGQRGLHPAVVRSRYGSAQICSTGLQAAVSMTTCSSTTCPTQRPYLRLTFSITTQILSLLWPKSCIQGATSPMWPIILCGCFTTRGSSCGCTRKTLTAWRDVSIFTFYSNW